MPREKKPTLKRRKDGRYKCKYHDMQFYGSTAEEAIAQREEYKAAEKAGLIRNISVQDYSLPWLKRTFPEVADSTYAGHAIHLQHLIDVIGPMQLSEVVPSNIKEVFSKEYRGLSNSYMKSARQLFCSLFDSAVADGYCRSNPARDRTAKPQKGKKPKERILSPQERWWIDNLCQDHRAHPAVMAMLYAGIRPQEVKAFDIDRDVDFINNIITIHQTAHLNGQKYDFTSEGKTELANRQIPLFPPLKAVLAGKHGRLISSAHGEPITRSTWRIVWNSYITSMETAINGIQKRWYGRTRKQRAMLDLKTLPAWIDFDIVPYTLRHAFCQMCRDSGVEINTCRKWMGHSDAQMILKVYDSVSEDRSEAEREKVENRLFRVRDGVQNEINKAASIDP